MSKEKMNELLADAEFKGWKILHVTGVMMAGFKAL